MGVKPGGDQRPVVAAAFDQARTHLRAGERFVWNATNVSRQLRERCVGLAADYRARVTLVGLGYTGTAVSRYCGESSVDQSGERRRVQTGRCI
jgi:predicted kinase